MLGGSARRCGRRRVRGLLPPLGVPLIDGGTIRLPRLVGESHASDMVLTGRGVPAPEAASMGLVNRVGGVRWGARRGARPRTPDRCLPAGLSSERSDVDAGSTRPNAGRCPLRDGTRSCDDPEWRDAGGSSAFRRWSRTPRTRGLTRCLGTRRSIDKTSARTPVGSSSTKAGLVSVAPPVMDSDERKQ